MATRSLTAHEGLANQPPLERGRDAWKEWAIVIEGCNVAMHHNLALALLLAQDITERGDCSDTGFPKQSIFADA
jgi:hypothetical protein